MLYYVRCRDGARYKVRDAVSLKDALDEIAHARVTGSVGGRSIVHPWNQPEYVLADVVRVNSDNTEVQPYQMAR